MASAKDIQCIYIHTCINIVMPLDIIDPSCNILKLLLWGLHKLYTCFNGTQCISLYIPSKSKLINTKLKIIFSIKAFSQHCWQAGWSWLWIFPDIEVREIVQRFSEYNLNRDHLDYHGLYILYTDCDVIVTPVASWGNGEADFSPWYTCGGSSFEYW